MDSSVNREQDGADGIASRTKLGALTFSNYVAFTLAFNLFIIVWGAFVRASKSGDGCGSHWPLCNGEAIPQAPALSTQIEYFHRLTSGLDIIVCLALLFWAFYAYPKRHGVRQGATLSFVALLGEAGIGAVLVLFGWVGTNDSVVRALVMAAHLGLTLFLVGSLTLTWWWSKGHRDIKLRGQGAVAWMVGLSLFGTALVGVSGAIAALGDTLSSGNVAGALGQGLSPTVEMLVRLRIIHPLLAVSVALYLVLTSSLMTALRPSGLVQKYSRWVQGIVVFQLVLGLVNVYLKAPIWMQLVHLLVAELLWISLVLMAANALAVGVPRVELTTETVDESLESSKPTWKDYLVLTKPRVISLLLFTTWTGMVIAARGWPGLTLFLVTGLGLYMAAGASNAINMVLERDLDVRMERTATRPTVTHKIPPRDALKFAFVLATGSFVMLWAVANLLAALMALSGLVVYIVVYTMLLKRRTWSNIVIGGAAGAFPPLVGYAAYANELTPLAWCLFAIIFLWTPVHFWALAILIKDDYEKAGVPMLPVVKGDRHTVIQIFGYAILTALVSAVPLVLGVRGPLYIGSAVLLNAVLLWQSYELWRQTTRPRASKLFHFSMLYLALLFLAMALDRSFWKSAPMSVAKAEIAMVSNSSKVQ